MRRPVLWILVLCLLLTWALSRNAISPERFTGVWYSTQSTAAYDFREGIIERLETSTIIDGAYSFTGSSITLFVTDLEGLDTVTTLYWISDKNGDFLCATPDGSGTIYFARSQTRK